MVSSGDQGGRRMRTTWCDGDAFWLQCRGEVLENVGSFLRIALSGADGTDAEAEVGRTWFDQHAKKIVPRLRFGDRLRIYGDPNRWVVVYEGMERTDIPAYQDRPLIFPEGGSAPRILASETDWELIPREDDEE